MLAFWDNVGAAPGQTRQDGVAGCMSVPAVLVSEGERRSKMETVRSVEAARTVCPSGVTTRSSIGRSGTD